MQNKKQTIRKIVGFLNNPDEEGGFWLPNIQRPFVWKEGQICCLFDSIMREYPISTFLVWKTKSEIRHRKFIDNWNDNLRQRLSIFYVPENDKKKCLVLDGQQRLQSLFIGLRGAYNGKELYFDILSGEVAAPDDIRYKFKFLNSSEASFPWIKFKDLVFTSKMLPATLDEIVHSSTKPLSDDDKSKIFNHLYLVDRTFKTEDTVSYQELDSIDNSALYAPDDVVEVFIRANSGGTMLGKSDLLFSLLNASWDFADERMEELLESLNKYGFAFGRDFILKTSLTLLDKKAAYKIEKFRDTDVRGKVKDNWNEITNAIQDVLDYVRSKTFIQHDKALPTYLVLIPLVYVRYKFKEEWKQARDVDSYLLRCSLSGAFGGQPDNLIDALVTKAVELKGFSLDEFFGVIRSQGRSLELTEDKFWEMGYGSSTIHLLFNLWYRDFKYTPAYANNLPQVDHIFPKSILKDVKVIKPETGREVMKYNQAERNQLANCMLLSQEENGAGGKSDTLPEEWFPKAVLKDKNYLDKHLIPSDPALWKLDRFDDFIEARKQLIRDKFKLLLISQA